MSPVDVAAAYRHCERVTRARAANFSYGIRLLPPPKRRALSAVYAFSRRVDDVGDGDLPEEEKLRRLDLARKSLEHVGLPSPDPVIAALGDAAGRFDLPLSAFEELVDGVEMDVRGTRYAAFDELLVYCRRVAGTVGRLSLAVFGSTDPEHATPLADDLGVAMQLTNILRDVREDRSRGRLYLPAEDLLRYGVDPERPEAAPPEALARLVRFEAMRAREWFARGLRLLPLLDRRSAACVSAMTGIYRRLLAHLEERPRELLDRRLSLPAWEKAWVAARSLAGVGA